MDEVRRYYSELVAASTPAADSWEPEADPALASAEIAAPPIHPEALSPRLEEDPALPSAESPVLSIHPEALSLRSDEDPALIGLEPAVEEAVNGKDGKPSSTAASVPNSPQAAADAPTAETEATTAEEAADDAAGATDALVAELVAELVAAAASEEAADAPSAAAMCEAVSPCGSPACLYAQITLRPHQQLGPLSASSSAEACSGGVAALKTLQQLLPTPVSPPMMASQ